MLEANFEKLIRFELEDNVKAMKLPNDEIVYKTRRDIIVHKIKNILIPTSFNRFYNIINELEEEVELCIKSNR